MIRGSSKGATVQDVLFVALTIGFFALMGLFVIGCERIVGVDDGEGAPGGDLTDVVSSSSVEGGEG